MVRDDIPKNLLNNGILSAYPNAEDSDDEDLDALGDSYDLNFGKTIFQSLFVNSYIIKV